MSFFSSGKPFAISDTTGLQTALDAKLALLEFWKKPIAAWQFENNVLDSADVFHGTIVGAGLSFVDGIIGKALQTDGTSYVHTVGRGRINPLEAISISAWVNLPATQIGDGEKNFIRKDSGFYLRVDPHAEAANRLSFFVFTTGNVLHDRLSYIYTPNTWFHVVAIYDSSTTIWQLYINGVLHVNNTIAGNLLLNQNTADIGIMASGNGAVKAKSGTRVDEVYIFDFPLNSKQVLRLYNAR